MPLRLWFRAPRRVLTMFLAITLVPAAALGWLGWKMLQQDRELERQREAEGLELLAGLIPPALERTLAGLEKYLDTPNASLPEDTVRLIADGNSFEARPAGRLLYYPSAAASAGLSSARFAEAEELELRRNDPAAAIVVLGKDVQSSDPVIRAGALLRLGRNAKKLGQEEVALRAYEQLAALGQVQVEGLPAAMAAREARCRLFEKAGRSQDLMAEAAALHGGLREGEWRIARATWEFHIEEAARWIAPSAPPPPDASRLALAAAAEWIHTWWRAHGDSSGRQFLTLEGRPALVAWKASGGRLTAVAAGPRTIQSTLNSVVHDPGFSYVLSDASDAAILGQAEVHPRLHVVRVPADTGLPWTLHLSRTDPPSPSARADFLAAGGAILAMLLLGGGYLVFRAIAREMAVARLQSDFVSSVSHEFRSPLTSICQLSHLLDSGRVPDDGQRGRVYSTLVRESERLHTLVESLLDFGKMEGGTLRYRLDPLDVEQLVADVTEAFRAHPGAQGYNIHVEISAELPHVAADREPLGRAIWNLLDNAVKYSPESRNIFVTVASAGEDVTICVRDEGVGIPAELHGEIFKKFVRGNPPPNVKGTGIGLAMVDHIVRGHGGRILLESRAGSGSTFTIALPCGRNA